MEDLQKTDSAIADKIFDECFNVLRSMITKGDNILEIVDSFRKNLVKIFLIEKTGYLIIECFTQT